MQSHVEKIWSYLSRFSARRRRPGRNMAGLGRLEVELLEDRTLLSNTGVVTGSFIGGQAINAAVSLASISGPTTPVNLTTHTNANGSFTFSGLPAGTYDISTEPFAGLNVVGTLSIGSVTTSASGTITSPTFTLSAGQTVVENVVVTGGLAPAGASITPFLTSYTGPTPGSGTPNNKPIISKAIADQTLPIATIAAASTGATESGSTVTITTTATNGFAVGESVVVAGVGVAGYNGTFTITAVTGTTFSYTDATTGLAASGGGTASINGTTLDLASNFTDADFTNTQVQWHITNGTTPETLNMTLFDAQAPATVANFLDYVNSGEYTNDVFSRLTTVSGAGIGVLQGGGIQLANPANTDPGLQLTEASPPDIPNEFLSSNSNVAGTIAMAQSTGINSANDEFFFNDVNNASSLDSQSFAVFGKLSDATSLTNLTTLAATGTQNETSATGAASIVASGVGLANVPLTNYTGTNFPTDAATSNLMVVNSITVTKADEESLTYSVTSNSDPSLVTAAFVPNHPEQLTLTYGAGSGTATIVVTATDRFGATTSQTFTVTVPTHAPAGTSNTVTTLENTPYTFKTADFGFTDSNTPVNTLKAVEITTVPTVGTLTDNASGTAVAVTAGTFVPVADITGNHLVFTPGTDASGTGYASFTFQVESNGSTSNGGIVTDPTARTMTVNVTLVNQAPHGVNNTVTTVENVGYVFSTNDFGFSDVNIPASTLKAVEITTLPSAGTLSDNGTPVTAGTFVPVADITGDLLVFTPTTDTSGTGYASFTFKVQNNGGTANGGVDTDPTARTMTINVTFINQAPSGVSNTVSTPASTPYVFQTADFGFSDPNIPAKSLQAVEITTLPTNGTITDNGTTITAGTFVPVADITGGLLVYTPTTNTNDSFTFQVQNNGGTANGGIDTDPSAKTMSITIT